jgi:hypothetical protein
VASPSKRHASDSLITAAIITWTGPIEVENNEPVFHASWRRGSMVNRAMVATGKLKGGVRPPVEGLSAIDYVRMSRKCSHRADGGRRGGHAGTVTRSDCAS